MKRAFCCLLIFSNLLLAAQQRDSLELEWSDTYSIEDTGNFHIAGTDDSSVYCYAYIDEREVWRTMRFDTRRMSVDWVLEIDLTDTLHGDEEEHRIRELYIRDGQFHVLSTITAEDSMFHYHSVIDESGVVIPFTLFLKRSLEHEHVRGMFNRVKPEFRHHVSYRITDDRLWLITAAIKGGMPRPHTGYFNGHYDSIRVYAFDEDLRQIFMYDPKYESPTNIHSIRTDSIGNLLMLVEDFETLSNGNTRIERISRLGNTERSDTLYIEDYRLMRPELVDIKGDLTVRGFYHENRSYTSEFFMGQDNYFHGYYTAIYDQDLQLITSHVTPIDLRIEPFFNSGSVKGNGIHDYLELHRAYRGRLGAISIYGGAESPYSPVLHNVIIHHMTPDYQVTKQRIIPQRAEALDSWTQSAVSIEAFHRDHEVHLLMHDNRENSQRTNPELAGNAIYDLDRHDFEYISTRSWMRDDFILDDFVFDQLGNMEVYQYELSNVPEKYLLMLGDATEIEEGDKKALIIPVRDKDSWMFAKLYTDQLHGLEE